MEWNKKQMNYFVIKDIIEMKKIRRIELNKNIELLFNQLNNLNNNLINQQENIVNQK